MLNGHLPFLICCNLIFSLYLMVTIVVLFFFSTQFKYSGEY